MRSSYIFYQGSKLQVEFYCDTKGCMPAKEYVESLPMNIQVKLAVFVKLIADEGRLYDLQKFRVVDKDEKIYEFKPLRYRFFTFFFERGRLIITNGYMKKSQKVDKKELAKAIRMKDSYLLRVKDGRYYEKR